jgi:hypothetical protein
MGDPSVVHEPAVKAAIYSALPLRRASVSTLYRYSGVCDLRNILLA